MSRITIITLIIISAWLQFKLWFRPEGIHAIIKLNSEIKHQQLELNNLQTRNNTLFKEIKRLKQDSKSIEEHARIVFGMIKKDETYYRVIEIANENFTK